jgi:hypothetical protein
VSVRPFPLVLVSAWNDSGGGFVHRLFDGHPECFVWPFELQLGTAEQSDGFASWFRAKYRWPVLLPDAASAPPERLFDVLLDDEVKGYLRDRAASKFAAFDLDLSIAAWRAEFSRRLAGTGRTVEDVVACYVESLFAAWRNRRASGRERLYLGHCPTIVVDADRILIDCPGARLVHVVRSPTSGFADFRRRVPEMELATYCRKWIVVNLLAFAFAQKYPARVTLVRLDELIAARQPALARLCAWLDIAYDSALERPTWNGAAIDRLPPFGAVPVVSAEHERDAAATLSAEERASIMRQTGAVQSLLGLS